MSAAGVLICVLATGAVAEAQSTPSMRDPVSPTGARPAPRILGLTARLAALSPPGIGAVGASVGVMSKLTIGGYGGVGAVWTYNCNGCYTVGGELVARPGPPGKSSLYLAFGAALYHHAPQNELLFLPLTVGYQWSWRVCDLRLGAGGFGIHRLEQPPCDEWCLDLTPPALPILEVVFTVRIV